MIKKIDQFKTLLVLGTFFGMVLSFQNCGNNPQFGVASDSSFSSRSLKTYDIHVGTTSRTSEVDIVWVVDNSGSMQEEAEHVRKNVASFAAQVRKKANLRMALISKKGNSGTSVSLPSDPDFLQIDQSVTSWDSLLLAASAMCASGSNASTSCKDIDNVNLIKPHNKLEKPNDEIKDSKKIRGVLRNFLSREKSKKVFVFVTDDNSSWSHEKFLAIARENLQGQTPMVSSFVQLPNSQKSCGDAVGKAYMDLAGKTGGSVYDICESDWASTFEQLANDVEREIETVFELPKGVKGGDVVSVLKNGRPLDPGTYQVTNTTIRISKSVGLQVGDLIQFIYQAD